MVLNLNMLCGSTRKSSSTSKSKKKLEWRLKRKTDPIPKGELIGIIRVSASQQRHFHIRINL
jgi:hypothetical protein